MLPIRCPSHRLVVPNSVLILVWAGNVKQLVALVKDRVLVRVILVNAVSLVAVGVVKVREEIVWEA